MTQPDIHICMSAFDEDENYTDDPDKIHGWTVYARFDPEFENDAPFELNDQRDFGTEECARDYAQSLMIKHDTTDFRVF